MAEIITHHDLLSMTTEIVAAHVSNNEVGKAELPALIETVYKSLGGLSGDFGFSGDRPQPAVPRGTPAGSGPPFRWMSTG